MLQRGHVSSFAIRTGVVLAPAAKAVVILHQLPGIVKQLIHKPLDSGLPVAVWRAEGLGGHGQRNSHQGYEIPFPVVHGRLDLETEVSRGAKVDVEPLRVEDHHGVAVGEDLEGLVDPLEEGVEGGFGEPGGQSSERVLVLSQIFSTTFAVSGFSASSTSKGRPIRRTDSRPPGSCVTVITMDPVHSSPPML